MMLLQKIVPKHSCSRALGTGVAQYLRVDLHRKERGGYWIAKGPDDVMGWGHRPVEQE